MRRARAIWMHLRALLRRRAAERELDQELRFHLERQISLNLASGMALGEASRAAVIHLGGIEQVKEESRAMSPVRYWNEFTRNLRYAARSLRHAPGFTVVAVLVLALGIGANTAIFSLVHAVLLRPLPFRQPQQLVALYETEAAPGNYPLTGPDYKDWEQQNRTFAAMALYTYPASRSLNGEGEPQRVRAVAAEADFFDLLGVEPAQGRFFRPGEDRPGKTNVAILSYGLWQKVFAGDRAIVGRTIRLDGANVTVVGVAPANFRLRSGVDLWVPINMQDLGMRGEHQYSGIGRLKPGISLAAARQDVAGIAARLARIYKNPSVGSSLVLLRDRLVLPAQRQSVETLAWIVGLVLLIACANIANLLLARALGRQKEMAVRLALGAGRGHIIRQLLTESVVLALAGAAVGAELAALAVRAVAASPAFPLPQFNTVAVDPAVLLATAALAVLCGLLFGLIPALQISRPRWNDELSGAGTLAGAGRRRRWMSDALIVGEVALTLALVVAAGLFLASYQRLRGNQLGVDANHLLTAAVALPDAAYHSSQQLASFDHALLPRLQALPGVQSAAMSSELPLEGGSNGYITPEGAAQEAKALVEWTRITPSFFATMGIPLVAGRAYTPEDIRPWETYFGFQGDDPNLAKKAAALQLNVIVNQAMAEHFFPGRDPIGRRFRQGDDGPWMTIVGVARNIAVFGLGDKPMAQAFMPALNADNPLHLELRSALPPATLAAELRTAVGSLDSTLPVFSIRTMDQVADESVAAIAFQKWLVAGFAALALLLAAAGLYGVMSYLVGARRREIGVRMALGASAGNVVRLVVGRGLALAGTGIVVGGLLSLLAGRALASQLYHVQPSDPAVFAAAVGVLLAASLLACGIPAWRAARVDPNQALRVG